MTGSAWLDSGALIAIEKRDRAIGAMLRVLQRARIPLRTSAAVVAQVWRDGRKQAGLARILSGVFLMPITETDARGTGELLGSSGTKDVVDAHLAFHVAPGDRVLTSDPVDVAHLLRVRSVRATV